MLSASFVVRTLNSEATLERCLRSIREQSVEVEIVVVDSGSSDGTSKLASRHADKWISLAPGEFSFGHALNVGADSAAGDVVMPLSSHCELSGIHHVREALEWHEDSEVAATTGVRHDARGCALTQAFRQTSWPLSANPWWGFSNTSCSFRKDVWEGLPFDDKLAACEDKAWASALFARSLAEHRAAIVYDPRLAVSSTHRRKQGMRRLHDRAFREGYALQTLLPTVNMDRTYMLRRWYAHIPVTYTYPRFLYLFMPHRMVEWSGLSAGATKARRSETSGRRPTR